MGKKVIGDKKDDWIAATSEGTKIMFENSAHEPKPILEEFLMTGICIKNGLSRIQ